GEADGERVVRVRERRVVLAGPRADRAVARHRRYVHARIRQDRRVPADHLGTAGGIEGRRHSATRRGVLGGGERDSHRRLGERRARLPQKSTGVEGHAWQHEDAGVEGPAAPGVDRERTGRGGSGDDDADRFIAPAGTVGRRVHRASTERGECDTRRRAVELESEAFDDGGLTRGENRLDGAVDVVDTGNRWPRFGGARTGPDRGEQGGRQTAAWAPTTTGRSLPGRSGLPAGDSPRARTIAWHPGRGLQSL